MWPRDFTFLFDKQNHMIRAPKSPVRVSLTSWSTCFGSTFCFTERVRSVLILFNRAYMPERETRLIQMILPRSITYKATLKWRIVQITALLRLKHCLRHHIESTSLKGFKGKFSHFLAISVLQSGQYHNKDSEQRFGRKNDSDEENCVVRQVSYRQFPGFDRTH